LASHIIPIPLIRGRGNSNSRKRIKIIIRIYSLRVYILLAFKAPLLGSIDLSIKIELFWNIEAVEPL
jgi:hypothetical protein